MPPLLNNGIDLRKRRLTIEAESGSLTDRKPHHDEKGGGLDLGALAKELAVQVDDLKNEGKRIEQENEAKRMEWVWLDLVRHHSLLPPSMTLFLWSYAHRQLTPLARTHARLCRNGKSWKRRTRG